MNMHSIQKCLLIILALATIYTQALHADCYAHTIFIPRQIAYNPVYEDALTFDEYTYMNDRFLFSVKPIYTQTVGKSIKKYFNINHLCTMNVQENGSGNIDSLWFQVIAAPGSYYSSILSFNPVQKTAGAILYCAWIFTPGFALTVNTAAVKRKNNMHICEVTSSNLGQMPGFSTVSQAFTSTDMNYGKICGTQSKGGVDDLQIKLLKNFKIGESFCGDIYGLIGVPTGHGSKARYLFEPLVGSNHVQLGLGLDAEQSFNSHLYLYGEFKWRYGFQATETRSFDMTPNGQWSRYLLFTTPTSPTNQFFAINDLTFKATVTPRNSFDLLLATHVQLAKFNFEFGYNFWYRQAEKICPCISLSDVGIADLIGIAQLANPTPVTVTTSSTATISQSVYPNQYQMKRDASYTLVTAANINSCSGAQAASCANAVFGSIGYHHNRLRVGINASYENAANSNTPSVASVWANIDISF